MKIIPNFSISQRNNKTQSFKQKKVNVTFVKEKLRKTGAEEALKNIFGERINEAKELLATLIRGKGITATENFKIKPVTRQTSVIVDNADKRLLSVIKSTHFSENPEVRNSPQAIKLTIHEISDSKNNLIQKAKTFTNEQGRYKIELYDANGTFTDEFLGIINYTSVDKQLNANPRLIKPVHNLPIESHQYERIKYYPDSKTSGYIEKESYDEYGNVMQIQVPIMEKGMLSAFKLLSPKRKLLSTVTAHGRNGERSSFWNKYGKK